MVDLGTSGRVARRCVGQVVDTRFGPLVGLEGAAHDRRSGRHRGQACADRGAPTMRTEIPHAHPTRRSRQVFDDGLEIDRFTCLDPALSQDRSALDNRYVVPAFQVAPIKLPIWIRKELIDRPVHRIHDRIHRIGRVVRVGSGCLWKAFATDVTNFIGRPHNHPKRAGHLRQSRSPDP